MKRENGFAVTVYFVREGIVCPVDLPRLRATISAQQIGNAWTRKAMALSSGSIGRFGDHLFL